MIVSQIAAASENNVIGRKLDLPWHIPEDLKFFKDTTKGHIIIQGRKTLESVGFKALPHRLNICVTRQTDLKADPAVVILPSLEEAIRFAESKIGEWPEEVFIIGGGEIYEQALPFSDKIYLTRIHTEIADGDAFFPEIPADFELVHEDARDGDPAYTFQTFERK